MDDYLCALRKKILFQGRLFVFTEHLGFYANLFGYRKIKTIRLQVGVESFGKSCCFALFSCQGKIKTNWLQVGGQHYGKSVSFCSVNERHGCQASAVALAGVLKSSNASDGSTPGATWERMQLLTNLPPHLVSILHCRTW